MQRLMRRSTDRRLRLPGICRALILLLVLAFAASGLLHISSGNNTAGAAMHMHDLASESHGSSGGEACCHEPDEHAHEPVCSTAAGCSLCVPIVSADPLVRPDAERAEMELTGSHSGLNQAPRIRPPKLLATV